MPVVAPPTLTAPGAVPDRADRATYSGRSIAFDDFIKNTQIPELQASLNNVFANATDAASSGTSAAASAGTATTQATAASTSASQAATAAAAIQWVSGTAYVVGDARWSPITKISYRRIIAGAGATDPSADAPNWGVIITPISAGGTGSGIATAAADALGAFRLGTLLGTVSQTAGVPTGRVIERGSNANGGYVRFADGTQICTCFLTIAASIAAGGNVVPVWTAPAAFVGEPSRIADVVFFTGAGATGNPVYGVAFGYSTGIFLQTGQNSSVSNASFTLGATATFSYTYRAMAIGRWF